jgi:hypothetical protein
MDDFTTLWLRHSPRRGEIARAVYVIDVGPASLAFEAQDRERAEDIARSPWFVRALDRFCPEGLRIAEAGCHLRSASAQEELTFRDVAAEFADAMGDLLVARLA